MSDNTLIAYLVLEYVSILLLLYLIVHCYVHRINATLMAFCVVAIFNNINETMLVINSLVSDPHSNASIAKTMGTPICIANAIIEHLLPLILTFLASCICFHIWFVVVTKSKKTERQMFKWYALASFGFPIFTTVLASILLKDRPALTSYPRRFYCALADTAVTAATFDLPLLAASIPGVLFALWTAFILLRHIRDFRQLLNPPRMSGLHIGHSLRLVFFSFVFAVIITMTALERLIYIFQGVPLHHEDTEQAGAMSDFSGSMVGVGIFLVFGTTSASFGTMKRLACCQSIRSWSVDEESGNSSGHGSSGSANSGSPHSRSRSNEDDDADIVDLEDIDIESTDSRSLDYREILRPPLRVARSNPNI